MKYKESVFWMDGTRESETIGLAPCGKQVYIPAPVPIAEIMEEKNGAVLMRTIWNGKDYFALGMRSDVVD